MTLSQSVPWFAALPSLYMSQVPAALPEPVVGKQRQPHLYSILLYYHLLPQPALLLL